MASWHTIDDLIRRGQDAGFTEEYNCRLRRLFPWPDNADTKRAITGFGCMFVTLEAGKRVPPHDHDEEEAFIVLRGTAVLEVDGQETVIGPCDVAYIPRQARHTLRNQTPDDFVMLDVYWDLGGNSQATLSDPK